MTAHTAGLLSRHIRGHLITPDAPGWDEARQAWRANVDQRPAAIVEPADAHDVTAAVTFAARHGLRVSVQCSGHGAGADLADTILVRTGWLREITIDDDVVQTGAGVRCRDLAAAAARNHLAGSFGSGATTGVTGYTLLGGLGALARMSGFLSDKMVAADVIIGDGTRLRCDGDSHPDLLWALRGGGGGCALVNGLELRLDQVPELYGGQVVWPAAAASEVFFAWRDWTAGLPPEMTSSVDVITLPPLPEVPEPLRGRRVATVTACYAGPGAEGAHLISALARAGQPTLSSCRPLSPADLGNLWNAPANPLPAVIRTEMLSGLPDAAIGELLRLAELDASSPVMLAQLRHLGGALAQDPPDGGGAVDRPAAPYQLELLGMAPTPQAAQAFGDRQRAVTAALAPWGTGMALPGFADPLTDTPERVWQPATRDRLKRVKDRYDPGGVLASAFPM